MESPIAGFLRGIWLASCCQALNFVSNKNDCEVDETSRCCWGPNPSYSFQANKWPHSMGVATES